MERDFKGIWIPKEIWLNKELTALDKIILAEIDSLDNENGCSATNEYIAEFCQCGITKVSTSIAKLIEMGFIQQVSFNGRTRILKGRLTKSERQIYKKCEQDINIINNNIINDDKIKHKYGEYKHVLLTNDEYERLAKDYGNDITRSAIQYLDEYIEMKGTKYKNHNLALRKWVFDALKEKKGKQGYEQHQYTKQQLNNLYDDINEIQV